MGKPDSDFQNIYLSPHFDDIAFSLGAWVAARPSGVLINLFTRSQYVVGAKAADRPTADEVSALRSAEDAAFARSHNLEKIELGAKDTSVLGRSYNDLDGLAEDRAQIFTPLEATLERLARHAQLQIFCPAAIGGHVNHLATRGVAMDLLERLPGVRICFYEDLPYAASRSARRRGLLDLRRVTAGVRLRRRSWKAGTGKLLDINRYSSQHSQPVTDLRRFSPASVWPMGMHEAVWE